MSPFIKPESLSGIYRILNIVTGKCYIGSAVKFSKRWYAHKHCLVNNKHHSAYLQAAYNKYGKDAFKFEILLACSKENLISFEQWAINTYNPEYNICKTAGSRLGSKASDETKAKISATKKGISYRTGYVTSDETKAKISASLKGNTYRRGSKASIETKAKMATSQRGHKVSDETKAKIAIANKGNTYNIGRKASNEAKAKMSNTLRNKSLLTIDIARAIRLDWATKEFKAKDLAIKYGISKAQIDNVVYNKSWKED